MVSFTKNVIVYEKRVVDAFTIEDAKNKVWADDQVGEMSDQYVIQDNDLIEIVDVKHLRMLEVSNETL
jgi:hypothetical protein